jgi:iron complex transport system ATP-binding protein
MRLADLSLAQVSYGGVPALREVTFSIDAGERIALVGPNGAGKSTLLKVLADVHPLEKGTLRWVGADGAPRGAWVPQEMDALYPITVEEYVALGLYPRARWWGWRWPEDGADRIDAALTRLGLGSLRRQPLTGLSGGERRRALLARGLAQGAPLLLLDEPTAHLDPRHQAEFLAHLSRLHAAGTAVVAALHDLSLAFGWASRTILLAEGRVFADGPTESVLTEENMTAAYGAPARLARDAEGRPAAVRFAAQSLEETR